MLDIRAAAIGTPDLLAALRIERREPATHSELTATVANEHFYAHGIVGLTRLRRSRCSFFGQPLFASS
jgi:hypothetical protein